MTRVLKGNAAHLPSPRRDDDEIPHDLGDGQEPVKKKPYGDPLPIAARARLVSLKTARDSARDAVASAVKRMSDLRAGLDYTSGPHPHLAVVSAQIAELDKTRAVQDERHRALAALVTNLDEFMTALPRGVILELVSVDAAKPDDGLTAVQTVEKLRIQIGNVQDHIAAIANAPLSKARLRELAERYVNELAARGRPRLVPDGDKLSIQVPGFTHDQSNAASLPFQAWLHQDAMTARLIAEVDALPDRAVTLTTPRERERRLAIGRDELLKLEHREEALIRIANREGTEIMRRPDASIFAVLSVTYPTKKKATAAA